MTSRPRHNLLHLFAVTVLPLQAAALTVHAFRFGISGHFVMMATVLLVIGAAYANVLYRRADGRDASMFYAHLDEGFELSPIDWLAIGSAVAWLLATVLLPIYVLG